MTSRMQSSERPRIPPPSKILSKATQSTSARLGYLPSDNNINGFWGSASCNVAAISMISRQYNAAYIQDESATIDEWSGDDSIAMSKEGKAEAEMLGV